MDRYVELMEWLSVLSEKDREDWKETAAFSCACQDCPSYTKCAKRKGERLFCLEGRTMNCIWPECTDACRCVDCPLALTYDMDQRFYCLKGAEEEIREGEGEA